MDPQGEHRDHAALAAPRHGGRLRTALLVVSGLVLLIGATLQAQEGWLLAKAALADHLIRRAFAQHRLDGKPHRPWSWADTHPIGRLRVPRLDVERMILAGATGESMAFGLGHAAESSTPNQDGLCVLAGHRDAAFAFLARLRPGDRLLIDTHASTRIYRVAAVEVVPEVGGPFLEGNGGPRLALVTCYPLRSYRPSTHRYIVWCVPATLSGAPSSQTDLRPGPASGQHRHGGHPNHACLVPIPTTRSAA